jgi:23S rRNA pseudouridine2605 synthase
MSLHSKDPRPAEPSGQDDDHAAAGGERVAKALARAGVASRREVERLIAAGRVALNGALLTTPAVKVAPSDVLTLDGRVVGQAEPTRLWRYHKPVGLVTTHKDPNGRPTVFEALPRNLPRVISIGRLDLASEGLLLLTNDGELARALELPNTGWVRRYRARARGRTDQAKLDKLKDGVTVEGVRYGAIEARLDKLKESADERAPANVWISVAITEGKNREVRRVLESIGLQVNRLIRMSYGPFQLGTLAAGQVEEIGPRVIREQLAGLIAPQNMPTGDRVMAAPEAVHRPSSGKRRAPLADGTSGDAMEPAKLVRKAGWAKPKVKAVYRGPSKPKAKTKTTISAKPAAPGAKAGKPAPRRPPKGR